jgi:tryptophanyl-tRNA synthetase
LTREVARRFNFFYPAGKNKLGFSYARLDKLVDDSGQNLARKLGAEVKGHHYHVISPSEVYNVIEPDILPEPKVLLTPSPKLPGTDGRKMSKSYGNTIQMTDPEPVVRQKLKTMVTDPARIRRTDPGDPDVCPVGDLHKVFSTPETLAKVYDGCRSAGIGCIECKSWVADALVQVLQPIQERRASFSEPQVEEILKEGSRRASVRAEETMQQVRTAMGMGE